MRLGQNPNKLVPMKILILNGPNLNMLGLREPNIYGTETLSDIEKLCHEAASGSIIDFRQSNNEGELVTWIQESINDFDGLIINAAAYTHTSVAIHDALQLVAYHIVEVHISDPETREEFRHRSYITTVAQKVIKGHGARGYVMAIEHLNGINK